MSCWNNTTAIYILYIFPHQQTLVASADVAYRSQGTYMLLWRKEAKDTVLTMQTCWLAGICWRHTRHIPYGELFMTDINNQLSIHTYTQWTFREHMSHWRNNGAIYRTKGATLLQRFSIAPASAQYAPAKCPLSSSSEEKNLWIHCLVRGKHQFSGCLQKLVHVRLFVRETDKPPELYSSNAGSILEMRCLSCRKGNRRTLFFFSFQIKF